MMMNLQVMGASVESDPNAAGWRRRSGGFAVRCSAAGVGAGGDAVVSLPDLGAAWWPQALAAPLQCSCPGRCGAAGAFIDNRCH